MRKLWFALRLIFFPVQLVLYWWHSILVFLTKPGAKLVIPMFLVGAGLLMRTFIDPVFGATLTDMADPWRGSAVFDYRIEIAFAVLFMTLYVLLMIAAKVLSPVVGTFPAPKRPLPPMAPLVVPDHTVKTVTASVALKKPVAGYFNGRLDRLTKRLPPDIRDVLQRRDPLVDPPEMDFRHAPPDEDGRDPSVSQRRPQPQGSMPQAAPRRAQPACGPPPGAPMQPQTRPMGAYGDQEPIDPLAPPPLRPGGR